MGLDLTGFNRLRLAEIKAQYDQKFTDVLGPVNTEPDSITGQIIGIFSAALDEVNEALQDIYDAMYPASAEGVSLDGSVSFVGMTRIGATATKVVGACYGTAGTVIPLGSIARAGTLQYASSYAVTISQANALDVEIDVTTVTNSTSYQIVAGGVLASYTSDASATGAEIAAGLAAAFNPVTFKAVATGSKIRLYPQDKKTGFALLVDPTLTISKLSSPVEFVCVTLGKNACPANTLTAIDTPILGWDSVSNIGAGITGRNIETDEELRVRHSLGVRASGSATVKAIRARLVAEVPDITAAYVYENRKHYEVGGMPPHSIECVVYGATDQDVMLKVWELKPAAIETHGSISGSVVDENGDTQVVKFSRPVPKYAWVKVTVTQLYPEESYPATTAQSIKEAVIAYSETLAIGEDIIAQRFFGPIYQATTGIGQITVEIAVTSTAGGVPSYTTSNIAVGRADVAVFDPTRVIVL